MSSQRTSAREAIATIGHALAGQSQAVMFVGGTVTALDPLEGGVLVCAFAKPKGAKPFDEGVVDADVSVEATAQWSVMRSRRW